MSNNKFFNQLVRSNDKIKKDRAMRVANASYREVNRFVMDLEAQKEAIEEILSSAMDLSTSNDRNSINAIDSFDANGWVSKIVKNRLQLKIVNEKLAVCYDLRADYFEVEGEEPSEDVAE